MKRIATAPFELTLPGGEKKMFALGEKIDDEHADHWWVKAHSTIVDPKAVAARLAQEAADADERQRLEEENKELRADAERLRREAEQHKADAAALRADAERFRAESASTPPAVGAADQKKKKDDKETPPK